MQDPQSPVKSTAIALKYDRKNGDSAPRVSASGRGHVAEEILRVARANDVPLRQDPELAEALAQVDVGTTIPPELFRAVAEILAFLYKMNGKV